MYKTVLRSKVDGLDQEYHSGFAGDDQKRVAFPQSMIAHRLLKAISHWLQKFSICCSCPNSRKWPSCKGYQLKRDNARFPTRLLVRKIITSSDLVLEAPSWVLISVPISQITHSLHLGRNRLPPLVFLLQDEIQNCRDQHISQQVCKRNAVADNVPRGVFGPVDLCTNNGAQVSNRDLHRVRNGPLRLSRDVDGRPREGKCRRGVDATGCEEGAYVGDARAADWIRVGEQNDVTYRTEGGGTGNEGGTLIQALGEDGDGQGCEKGESVGRDREELCLGGSISQGFDNGWLYGLINLGRTEGYLDWSNQLTKNKE